MSVVITYNQSPPQDMNTHAVDGDQIQFTEVISSNNSSINILPAVIVRA